MLYRLYCYSPLASLVSSTHSTVQHSSPNSSSNTSTAKSIKKNNVIKMHLNYNQSQPYHNRPPLLRPYHNRHPHLHRIEICCQELVQLGKFLILTRRLWLPFLVLHSRHLWRTLPAYPQQNFAWTRSSSFRILF